MVMKVSLKPRFESFRLEVYAQFSMSSYLFPIQRELTQAKTWQWKFRKSNYQTCCPPEALLPCPLRSVRSDTALWDTAGAGSGTIDMFSEDVSGWVTSRTVGSTERCCRFLLNLLHSNQFVATSVYPSCASALLIDTSRNYAQASQTTVQCYVRHALQGAWFSEL